MLRAEHFDAFLSSAFSALIRQTKAKPERGSPVLRSGLSYSTRELTGLVVITGELTGVLFYSMSLATAVKLQALNEPRNAPELAQLAETVVLQTARAIAEGGLKRLSRLGCQCQIGQAMIVYGFGEPLTDASPVLVVPIYTLFGDMDFGVALQLAEAAGHWRLICARPEALRPPIAAQLLSTPPPAAGESTDRAEASAEPAGEAPAESDLEKNAGEQAKGFAEEAAPSSEESQPHENTSGERAA